MIKWSKINEKTQPTIVCDGYYLECPNPNCLNWDIDYKELKCRKCGQLFDWKWTEIFEEKETK